MSSRYINEARLGQQITPFLFEGVHTVRVVDKEGDPWFIAKDVASVLGHRDATAAIRGLDDDEKGTHNLCTPGGDQEVIVVSEPGVYQLLFTSRKAVGHRLRRWLAHEVIPSIRKTGSYFGTKPKEPNFCEIAEHDGMKLRIVTEGRHTFGTMAAGQLWLKLGLPTVPAMFNQPRQIDLFDYSAIRANAETAG